MLYLDNCSTTKIDKRVLDEYVKSCNEDVFNPSGILNASFLMEEKINICRKRILEKLELNNYRVIFTSSATESNNTIIRTFDLKNNSIGYIELDHPSIVNTVINSRNANSIKISVNNLGKVIINEIPKNIDLLSISHVNSITGVIQDISEIHEYCYANNIKLHIDCTQSIGKIKIDKNSFDYLTYSGHKINSVKGSATLIFRDGLKIAPLLFGGNQEGGFRSSTENLPAIRAITLATELIIDEMDDNNFIDMRNLLFKSLSDISEFLFFDYQPNNFMLIKLKTLSEPIIHFLENNSIYVSPTSSCSSRNNKNELIDTKKTIRICLTKMHKRDEIIYFIDKIKEAYNYVKH